MDEGQSMRRGLFWWILFTILWQKKGVLENQPKIISGRLECAREYGGNRAFLLIFLLIDSLYMASLTLLQDENYLNPIRNRIKKNTSNKPKPLTPANTTITPIRVMPEPPNTQKQIRFRDLSKDRPQYYTDLQKPSQQQSFRELSKKHSSPFSSIRKRLFTNDQSSTSREKSMSFSDVIKLSREKKLREESRCKARVKKEGGNSDKNVKAFNVLKTRLLGENNPNAGNVIKPPLQHAFNQESSKHIVKQRAHPPRPKQSSSQQQLDLVRTSTQVQSFNPRTSLAMSPL